MVARPSFLSRVSVLDFSIWRPGPYATSLLVPLGADVLKVEPPGGDPMRHYPELFESVNAGKRSIALDLKDPADRARALDLSGEADVVVEGFRPGVMTRLGLDEAAVRAVNPDTVYCSVSGYGQHDERALLPGHDVNYQAWAGSLSPEGQRATMPILPVADLASGMAAAFGICAALLGRDRGGAGAYLDVSMTDVMSTWTGSATTVTDTPGTGGPPTGAPPTDTPPTGAPGRSSAVPGYGIFGTADGGQVALGVLSEDHFWSALCETIGLDAVATLDFSERSRRGAALNEDVAAAIARHERDVLVAALVRAGVPVAPVLNRSAMVAAAPFPSFPIRLGGEPGGGGPAPSAPALDQHRGQGFVR